MSYVSHDGLAYFKHKLDQKFISNITSENGALKIILGDGTVLKSIQDTTVTQKKSTANELYPLLLCYDAMADQDQLSKETWFGQHILANPYYGYLASRGMYVKHPTFNRRNGVSQKVEWAYDFTDAVSGLGNPMSQVYAYVDPASEGGEHCIELRLYGNPNVSPTVPSVNDSTNTFSIGVGVTGGNVQFGYCPSTPLYLDNGSTLRTEATGHGNDIITRDWLNLNGSFTGLVHTTMNETIDGAKTFKKTVTINSGDNSNKAGLTVQGNASIGGNSTVAGNSSISGNETVGGTLTSTGKFIANGTAEIKGGSGNTPSLLVTGNETVTGKLTGTGTAEFSGGSGNTPTLTVNGNESVSGNSSVGGNSSITGNETVGGNISTTNGNISTTNGTVSGKTGVIGSGGLTVNGNETVTGEIYKTVNNTPQEYVSYVTNKTETKTTIVNNLIKDKGGLAIDSNKNIYVSLKSGGGVKLNSSGQLYVDFSLDSGASAEAQAAANAMKEQILGTLGMQIPLTSNLTFYVNKGHTNATNTWRNSQGVIDKTVGTTDKPFKTIQAAIDCATQGYSVGSRHIDIVITKSSDAGYNESVSLPQYQHTTGYIKLVSANTSNASSYAVITNKATTLDDKAARVVGGLIAVNGSGWYIENIKFDSQISDPGDDVAHFPSCISAGTNASVVVRGCSFNFNYTGSAPNGSVYMRMVSATSGGVISFQLMDSAQTTVSVTQGNANSLNVFFCERQGQINFNATNSGDADSSWHYIACNGSCSTFISLSIGSVFAVIGGAKYLTGFTGNITGVNCSVKVLSSLSCGSDLPSALTTGTKDSTSYVSSGIDVS